MCGVYNAAFLVKKVEKNRKKVLTSEGVCGNIVERPKIWVYGECGVKKRAAKAGTDLEN